jgi:hypothetical protein
MTKEELKELMQEDRPRQQILEVIDFRESDRGIEGELYLAKVKMRTIHTSLDGVDDWTGIAEDMPYPLGPAKELHDAKIAEMLERSFKNALNFQKNKKA